METRPIKTNWKANGGLQYRLMKVEGNLALVEVETVGYEVHILRKEKITDFIRRENETYEFMIKYASNEDFGSYGWFLPTLQKANGLFEKIKVSERFKDI